MSKNSKYTIELQIRDKHIGTLNLRAALAIPDEQIYDALQPIKSNSTSIGAFMDGQNEQQIQQIKAARMVAARNIAEQITEFLYKELFTLNDTHNGYHKEQR